jgi:hypothetical protein
MSLSKLFHFHGNEEDGDGHFMDAMVIVFGNFPSHHTFRIYGETFTLRDGVCKGNIPRYVFLKSWLDFCGTNSVYITLADSPSEVKARATLVDNAKTNAQIYEKLFNCYYEHYDDPGGFLSAVKTLEDQYNMSFDDIFNKENVSDLDYLQGHCMDTIDQAYSDAVDLNTNGMKLFKEWLDDNRPEYCDWEIIPICPPRICDDESRICHLDATTIASYTPPCVAAVPCAEPDTAFSGAAAVDASAPVAVAPRSVSALHDDSSDSDSSDDDVDSDHTVSSPPVEQTSSTT